MTSVVIVGHGGGTSPPERMQAWVSVGGSQPVHVRTGLGATGRESDGSNEDQKGFESCSGVGVRELEAGVRISEERTIFSSAGRLGVPLQHGQNRDPRGEGGGVKIQRVIRLEVPLACQNAYRLTKKYHTVFQRADSYP